MLRATTSASNVFRRALCPGSEVLEEGLQDEDSPQSREGTFLHAYDANPKLERAVLTPNQQDLLRIAAELDEFVFSTVATQFGLTSDEPFEEVRESELLALRGSDYETPGHCDRARYYPRIKLLVVRDAKFGYKIVTPAAANLQLRTYAIGGSEAWDAENIVVAITQPRLSYYERVTLASYSREDIEASRAELIAIRKASWDPNAPLHAGEEQCRYCRARLLCPAFAEKFQGGVALVTVEPGTVAKRTDSAERSLAQCTDDQLDRVLIALQLADFIADLARDEARRRIEAGGLSTWQLGKPQEIRKITDPRRAVSLFALRGDLTRDEVLACSKPSITKIEEKIRAKKKCTWQEARDLVEKTLQSVIEREPKKAPLKRVK